MRNEARPSNDRELVVTRLIDAPRRLVFRAWTEPELLAQWTAPPPFTAVRVDIDPRAGGTNFVVLRDPAGNEHAHGGVYLEVVKDARIVFTDAFTSGWIPSSKPFMMVFVTFDEEAGQTRYVARARHWSKADCQAHDEMGFHRNWSRCADQLARLVADLEHSQRVSA